MTDYMSIRRARLEAWEEWRTASDFRLLALRLGVGGIFDGISSRAARGRIQGEYIDDGSIHQWCVSNRYKPILENIMLKQMLPVIMVDVQEAAQYWGVRGALAHELGHHIDYLANKKYDYRTPSKAFLSAFQRAELWAHPVENCELIAETLGAYLSAHELNAVLLSEVNKVLAKLPRSKAKLINEFRRARTTQEEVAA